MRCHTRLIGMATLLALAASGGVLAQDLPDPYFIDSNGDGIDGELADAIFVAPPPLGDNSNDGLTPSTPVATINTGITRAVSSARSQVLIQVGTYSESVQLASGVSLFGGFDANWARVPSTDVVATVVQSPASGMLASAINATTQVSFLTLRNDVSATPNGASRYALRVINSSGLRLWYNRIQPGNGATGTFGVAGPNGGPITAQAEPGQDAEESNATQPKLGGAGGTSSCGRTGGNGGNGGVGAQSGMPGASGVGGTSGGSGGAASSSAGADAQNGQSGQNGSPGSDGTHGSVAVAVVGGIDGGTVLYVPPVSGNGATGVGGNGGGGGGGGGGQDCGLCSQDLGAGGGGGGAGGCPGGRGFGGGGGGGSFGVLIASGSSVDVRDNAFFMGSGGTGGNGGNRGLGSDGADGAPGGTTQASIEGGAGGHGGNGGDGGDGGSGAGGHGGPSIGMLDPGNGALVQRMRYVQASSPGEAGEHGIGNVNAQPSPGIRATRYPDSVPAQGEPSPVFSAFTVHEPVSGSTIAYIPITLSGTTENITSVNYTVASGTATGGGVDFTLANGAVVFNPWTDEASIAVTLHADGTPDSGETFSIGAGLGVPATITILEDALFANGFD
jgi:hypothetical protein